MSEENKNESGLAKILANIELIKKLSGFLSDPINVFINRRIGYRELHLKWMMVVAIGMFVIALLFPDFAGPNPILVYVYAIIMVIICWYQKWRRFDEIFNLGMKWHSRSVGISFLDGLPLPNFLRRFSRAERFLLPILIMIPGSIILLYLTHFLGTIILFSGFFLHVYQEEIFKTDINKILDGYDSVIESEFQANLMANMANGMRADLAQEKRDGAGLSLPAGLGKDCQ